MRDNRRKNKQLFDCQIYNKIKRWEIKVRKLHPLGTMIVHVNVQ